MIFSIYELIESIIDKILEIITTNIHSHRDLNDSYRTNVQNFIPIHTKSNYIDYFSNSTTSKYRGCLKI